MNAGAVPLLLMSAAIGLTLAFATLRTAWLSLAAAAVSAFVAALVPIPERLGEEVLAGLLLSTLATAALVYLPNRLHQRLTLAAAINGGAWLGLSASASQMKSELTLALPLSLLFIPGIWFTRRGYDIVIKVISSWLIAIAALALFVSLVPTPGYESDHME